MRDEARWLVEPLPGVSDEAVLEALHALGVRHVKHLGAGFISVRTDQATVVRLKHLATFHLKAHTKPN